MTITMGSLKMGPPARALKEAEVKGQERASVAQPATQAQTQAPPLTHSPSFMRMVDDKVQLQREKDQLAQEVEELRQQLLASPLRARQEQDKRIAAIEADLRAARDNLVRKTAEADQAREALAREQTAAKAEIEKSAAIARRLALSQEMLSRATRGAATSSGDATPVGRVEAIVESALPAPSLPAIAPQPARGHVSVPKTPAKMSPIVTEQNSAHSREDPLNLTHFFGNVLQEVTGSSWGLGSGSPSIRGLQSSRERPGDGSMLLSPPAGAKIIQVDTPYTMGGDLKVREHVLQSPVTSRKAAQSKEPEAALDLNHFLSEEPIGPAPKTPSARSRSRASRRDARNERVANSEARASLHQPTL